MAQNTGDLAVHVEESVDAIADFHNAHYRSASALQKLIDAVTGVVSRPAFVIALVGAVALWIGLTVHWADGEVHHPSFAWLELAATLVALLVAVLILVTQRREDELAERRAQLTLEVALLADKRSAKIISLIEEMRRDLPGLADRADAESEQMAKPADPQDMMAEIDRRDDKRS